eukprot:m.311379 g.311379  ORF g.311379 m.311379 type:complete len:423 (+) comp67360_c0_seq1:34-1302(+)
MTTSLKLPPSGTKLGFLLDESISFARDPMNFVEKKQTTLGPLFRTRILGKSTVFVTSNDDVRHLLTEHTENYHRAVMDHIQDLFGVRSIIFSDKDDFARLRGIMHAVVEPSRIAEQNQLIDSVIDDHLGKLDGKGAVPLYKTFKSLVTDLSLALFLGMGLDELKKKSEHFSSLATDHWRGVVSVPIRFKLPFYGKSAFRAALDARGKLMTEIYRRMAKAGERSLLRALADGGFHDKEEAAIHVLLFISALIPKALGSLVTSFCTELAGEKRKEHREHALREDSFLDDVLLEVQRLWPPFLGGRKMVTHDFELGGYNISQGHSIIYTTFTANRDKNIFPQPEEFNPSRWTTCNAESKDLVWTFGAGQRNCVGQALSKALMKRCCLYLLHHFTWQCPEGQDLTFKWLPVSRPRENVVAHFTKRS